MAQQNHFNFGELIEYESTNRIFLHGNFVPMTKRCGEREGRILSEGARDAVYGNYTGRPTRKERFCKGVSGDRHIEGNGYDVFVPAYANPNDKAHNEFIMRRTARKWGDEQTESRIANSVRLSERWLNEVLEACRPFTRQADIPARLRRELRNKINLGVMLDICSLYCPENIGPNL